MRRPGLKQRVVIVTAVSTSLGMIALTVLVQVVLALIVDHDIAGVLADRSDAVGSTLAVGVGSLQPRETPTVLDEHTWIYDDRGVLVEGSPIGAPLAPALQRLRASRARTTVDTGEFRLLAVPVQTSPGKVVGVVVVGERLTPYERTERNALLVSVFLGVLVVAGVTGLVAWAVHRALHPVAAMSARADEWSEHDLSRRFDLGEGGDEITALGRTLDALLERVSRVIRGEQRLSSELAHELRTPLTAIRGEAELALSRDGVDSDARDSLERVVRSASQLGDIITTLMSMSRQPARLDESVSVEAALAGAVGSVADHGQRESVTVVQPESVVDVFVAAPESAVVRIVAPIVDNALRYGRDVVRVSAEVDEHTVHIVVDDDGPGLGDVAAEDAFSAGLRHPESPGAGLGLALSRRLARAVGGDVTHVERDVGTRFVIHLPRA